MAYFTSLYSPYPILTHSLASGEYSTVNTYAGQNTGQADDVESQAPHQKDTEHLLYDARCWRAS